MSIRITDYGLDAVAAVNSPSSWINYTAVGTGSTAPSQADTALEAEVARTSSSGGFSGTKQVVQDATGNKLRYEATSYRVFNFTSSYNLTEYGHFTGSSGGNAVFRDLFRQDPNDPNSQAVTISVQNGDQLQIIRTLVIEVPWEEVTTTQVLTVPGGSDISLPGTQTVGIKTSYSGLAELFEYVLWPGATTSRFYLLDPGVDSSRTTGAGSFIVYGSASEDAYVSGSYTRRRRRTFTTAEANQQIGGWAISYSNRYNNYCFKFVIDPNTNFTKSNTHTLEILFDVSWSRG